MPYALLPTVNCLPPTALLRDSRAQHRELLLFLLTLDHDRGLHQDQQDLLVLGGRTIREQPLEERDLRQHRNAGFTLDFASERLPAEQQRAAVRNADRRANFGDLQNRLLNRTGGVIRAATVAENVRPGGKRRRHLLVALERER